MNPSVLLNNPALKNISQEKLNFLLHFATENRDKNPKDMVPLFLAASASAKKQGMSFSGSESALILEIMKQNMTEQEKNKVDLIVNMFQKQKGDSK